jgi:hypothetical protein
MVQGVGQVRKMLVKGCKLIILMSFAELMYSMAIVVNSNNNKFETRF